MARNIIKLAGGTFANLKALSGADALQYREVVLTTDTHELYAGTGDGGFSLLGNVTIGTKSGMVEMDAVEGRLYLDYTNGLLYVGTGAGWKRTGFAIASKSGLVYNEETGELSVATDNKTIIINDSNALEVNNVDYGLF